MMKAISVLSYID